jgi:hypothetical protein
MRRYHEFKANNWRVGSAWGIFSVPLIHRVGYQCSNHYRALLRSSYLQDSNYRDDGTGNMKYTGGVKDTNDKVAPALSFFFSLHKMLPIDC